MVSIDKILLWKRRLNRLQTLLDLYSSRPDLRESYPEISGEELHPLSIGRRVRPGVFCRIFTGTCFSPTQAGMQSTATLKYSNVVNNTA
jgi:hypothetical protein